MWNLFNYRCVLVHNMIVSQMVLAKTHWLILVFSASFRRSCAHCAAKQSKDAKFNHSMFKARQPPRIGWWVAAWGTKLKVTLCLTLGTVLWPSNGVCAKGVRLFHGIRASWRISWTQRESNEGKNIFHKRNKVCTILKKIRRC